MIGAVLIIALGAIGLVVALDDDDRRGDSAADRSRSDRSDERETKGAEDGEDSASADDPDATDATGAAAAGFECWDGTQADDLASCGEPTGATGLHWVFPDSAAKGCRSAGGDVRSTEIDCVLRATSGRPVRVHYTEWRKWSAAHAEYSKQNVQGAVTRWRGFLRWYISPMRGEWDVKVALLHRDQPWSVTVYGQTAADRDEVLRGLRFRPDAELAGRRAD